MDKKQIKAAVANQLSLGDSKSKIFSQYSGKALKDAPLAVLIASHPDPRLCTKHEKLVDLMVVIAWIQLGLGVLASLAMGFTVGWGVAGIIAAVVGAFCYLFVWGFNNNKVGIYTASICLSISTLPRGFNGFMEAPLLNGTLVAISVALIAFTWYVRQKLFPDFAFLSPRKLNGKYVFSS